MMRYAFVCTNYNNAHFTEKAALTLFAQEHPPEVMIVVDNASNEKDVAALRELAARNDRVDLVLRQDNIGYFPGLNAGIRRAVELGPWDALVIGNNDLEFPPEFGATLEAAIPRLAHCPVISPRIQTMDGIEQNPHVVSGVSRPRELIYDLYFSNYYLAGLIRRLAHLTRSFTDRSDEEGHGEAQYIYQGHGSCYILTPLFLEVFGEFWSPTFLMGEEYFLSKQLSDKGYRTFYEPSILVRHKCNGSIGNLPSRRTWELAKDAHKIYRRYVSPWKRQGGAF